MIAKLSYFFCLRVQKKTQQIASKKFLLHPFILALNIPLSRGDSTLFLESHFLLDSLCYGNLNLARQHSLPLHDTKELGFLHEKNALVPQQQ